MHEGIPLPLIQRELGESTACEPGPTVSTVLAFGYVRCVYP
jgi:hypothetical protein